jgi:hypothetical protein
MPAHMGLYRAIMSCRLGCDALDGKINTPIGVSQTEWAVYNMLKAVEELAKERLEAHELTRKTWAARDDGCRK